MKIKALVADFDGTLVGSDHLLADELEVAIKKFIKDGKIFSLATGRAYEGVVKAVVIKLGLDGLVISRGGSEIIEAKTHRVVWGKYIDSQLADQVLAELAKIPDLFYAAEAGKYIFTPQGAPHSNFGVGAEFKDLIELPGEKIPKIMLPTLYAENMIDSILAKFTQLFSTLHLAKTASKTGFGIDVNSGEAGKYLALLEFAKLSNLSPHEIAGVGDGFNDYPLLSACGLKIAMGNAPDSLKEIADYVVGPQEENGFLEVLEIAARN